VATTDARQLSSPRAVPDVNRLDGGDRLDGGLRRVARPGRPPTLGDKLNEAMRQRSHTTDAAARAMEVTSDEVLAWSADGQIPDRTHDAALTEYLQVDERQVRALILRGQMRRTQARIRN
jgi:hypothetical protein